MNQFYIPDYELLEFVLNHTKNNQVLYSSDFLRRYTVEHPKVARARLDTLKDINVITECERRGIEVTPYGKMLYHNRKAHTKHDWIMLFITSFVIPFLVAWTTSLLTQKS